MAFYLNKKEDKFPAVKMVNVKLEEDLLRFTWEKLPEVYQGLIDINAEMLIIVKELERLKTIEKRFPKQKKIISIEETNLNRTNATLAKSIADLEYRIESLFVAFSVNIKTGTEKMETEREELKTMITEVLQTSTEVTQRLKDRPVEEKTVVDKILEKIGLGTKKSATS